MIIAFNLIGVCVCWCEWGSSRGARSICVYFLASLLQLVLVVSVGCVGVLLAVVVGVAGSVVVGGVDGVLGGVGGVVCGGGVVGVLLWRAAF